MDMSAISVWPRTQTCAWARVPAQRSYPEVAWSTSVRMSKHVLKTCLHPCSHARLHTWLHKCVHTCLHTCVHLCTHMFTHTFAPMVAHKHTHMVIDTDLLGKASNVRGHSYIGHICIDHNYIGHNYIGDAHGPARQGWSSAPLHAITT